MSRGNDWRYSDATLTTTVNKNAGRARGRREKGKMNSTEKRFAEHLALRLAAGEILWWAFEGIKFKIAVDCHFTPDFDYLLADGTLCIADTKGKQTATAKSGESYERPHYEDDARVKMCACASLFPMLFLMVWQGSDGNWNEEPLTGIARS